MSVCKYIISFNIALVSLFPFQAFSQQMNNGKGLADDNSAKVILKPGLHYMIGSSFIGIPHVGSVSAVTLSPGLSVPLSPKLSVEGGIMASYYYFTPWKSDIGGFSYGTFNGLSVYGSASYHFNPQLTLYGSAIRQLAGNSAFYVIPKSSYTIGSAYDFGDISIGVSFQISKWDNVYSPFPMNGSQGFNSPLRQTRVSH